MSNQSNRPPNRFPGTDDKTGWPVEPKYFCANETFTGNDFAPFLMSAAGRELVGIKFCHLRLKAGPMVCGYEPPGCPFYGRYPDMGKFSEEGG